MHFITSTSCLRRLFLPVIALLAVLSAIPNTTAAKARNVFPQEEILAQVSMGPNPMVELDGMNKEVLYALRRQYVYQYPQLAPVEYWPTDAIFGQAESGRPWWGILGLSYYGPGKKGIEGPSEESRFILNPYILVGLDAPNAIVCQGCPPPVASYPFPKGVVWERRNVARAYYDVGSYWATMRKYGHSDAFKQTMTLIAYNARDFGYNFLAVDMAQSSNVLPFPATSAPAEIRQYIHRGGSCGYQGGCNNMSPHQPELEMPLKALPATAYIKLWRTQPANIQAAPDFVYILGMK